MGVASLSPGNTTSESKCACVRACERACDRAFITVSIFISSKSLNLFGVHCFAVLITPSSLRGLNFLFGICPTGHKCSMF